MSDTAIRVEHLSKRYKIGGQQTQYKTLRESLMAAARAPLRWLKGERREDKTFWALDDISFEVKHSEVVGIIGRNGAGKSTLLKILSRITKPTRGRVELFGRVGSLLEVGTGFHAELSGRENIYLNAAILGMGRKEIERKFDEIVDFSGVEKFLDTPVKFYSSGMYVRLAFAVAAHMDPEILIVDEVLSVGDAEFQKKCLGKMGNVAKEGRTVLLVSHNLGAIQQLCNQAMVLNSGKISMTGPVNKAIEHYLSIAAHQQAERTWDSPDQPGNDIVRLVAVRLRDQRGELAAEFDVREPVQIEVEYCVLQEGHQICVVLELLGFGAVIAVAFDDYIQRSWHQQPPRYPGRYRAIFKVPGDFLNESQVSINLRIFSPPDPPNANPHVRLLDVIQFTVLDRIDTEGVRGYFPYNWGAPVLRPRLESITEKISDEISSTNRISEG